MLVDFVAVIERSGVTISEVNEAFKAASEGALKGILSTVDLDDQSLIAKAKASPGLVGRDLVQEVVGGGVRHWIALTTAAAVGIPDHLIQVLGW